jgi:hypothetical protein
MAVQEAPGMTDDLIYSDRALISSKPRSKRDWPSFSAFSAFTFTTALFVEIHGFPLMIYLISGWLMRRYPGVDFFSHDAGHLWNTLFGWKVNPHFDPLHVLSNILILGGFLLLSAAWKVLYEAQRSRTLCLRAPPATRRLHSHHARLFAPMADIGYIDYVSDLGHDVCAIGAAGGTGSTIRVRRGVSALRRSDAGFSAPRKAHGGQTGVTSILLQASTCAIQDEPT